MLRIGTLNLILQYRRVHIRPQTVTVAHYAEQSEPEVQAKVRGSETRRQTRSTTTKRKRTFKELHEDLQPDHANKEPDLVDLGALGTDALEPRTALGDPRSPAVTPSMTMDPITPQHRRFVLGIFSRRLSLGSNRNPTLVRCDLPPCQEMR